MNRPLVRRMQDFDTTVFAVMSALAAQTGAINLGQGFPDEDGPAPVLRRAMTAIEDGINQYPPLRGSQVLREAVAAHQHRFYGLDCDPDQEIMVTAGATEAMTCSLLALCEPHDEVVVIEPYYDAYAAAIALAGAQRVGVALTLPDLTVDLEALRAAVGPRTRAIVLNTPHNPTGKVFSQAELAGIAKIALDHDCYILVDEVYEHLVYDGARHHCLAAVVAADPALAALRSRILTISSAGKTFSVTGWKVGWLSGAPEVIAAVATVKQYVTFSGGAPFQPAIAAGLAQEDSVFEEFADSLRRRRDLLAEGLDAAGMTVLGGQGTYFLLADATDIGGVDADRFCRELPERCGVVAIPVSAFCDDPTTAPGLIRFAYCKREEVLVEAVRRLSALRR
ncbi:aminotransferase class I/II-fold pyridoxal phosphate-dependent enzyme [Austwickia sp. TVS 96-490-7B]|uniref:aminotransferase class I/II-fold pyridoxal phosphate-dependent enzyme n=1 Tax=Austwickia sp. TVS 96-490-7B TaxID=2830843 RepID=UPI001C55BFAC|nr:aminotransferase class I/II-fold pyridoxal phosphate-dependent enzyme [Austwickia sp. TVS 96-490-7B]